MTLPFYNGCLFYRRDSFFQVFCSNFKKTREVTKLKKKKNSVSVGEPPYHVQNDIYIT